MDHKFVSEWHDIMRVCVIIHRADINSDPERDGFRSMCHFPSNILALFCFVEMIPGFLTSGVLEFKALKRENKCLVVPRT